MKNPPDIRLVLDIGNTRCKAAVFERDSLVSLWSGPGLEGEVLDRMINEYRPAGVIVSSVRSGDPMQTPVVGGAQDGDGDVVHLGGFCGRYDLDLLAAGPHLQLPVAIRYHTTETLGSDRLAAAVAAWHFFPQKNTLVVNAGTCLTTDLVTSQGEYLGGTISPGFSMRFRALRHFTGNLPLVDPRTGYERADRDGGNADPAGNVGKMGTDSSPELFSRPFVGQTTRDAIIAGVFYGMVAEMDGMIEAWKHKTGTLNVILSGGDGKMFDKKLKNRIFAVENIVLHGLNQMLLYNAK